MFGYDALRLLAIFALLVCVTTAFAGEQSELLKRATAAYAGAAPLVDPGQLPPKAQMQHAIISGHEEHVLRLLAANKQGSKTATDSPLITAIRRRHIPIASYLLQAGYNPHVRLANGQTALHLIAANNLNQALPLLLANGFRELDVLDQRGQSALLVAVKAGNHAGAEKLLIAGANPNIAEGQARAPIWAAVANNDPSMLALLLTRKAVTDITTTSARSVFDVVLAKNDLAMLQVLLPHNNHHLRVSGSMLGKAAISDRSDLIRLFASSGVDLSAPDRKNVAALFHAIKKRHTNVLSTLLTAGVDPNSVDKAGASALVRAANCAPCIEVLIAAGAGVDFGGKPIAGKSRLISTPLIQAVRTGRMEAVKRLLQAGAEVAAQDSQGRTALEYAAANKGSAHIIHVLAQHGADANKHAHGKWPPLLQAAKSTDTETLTALLKSGANTDTNSRYPSALLHVVGNNDLASTQALIAYGADVNRQDARGRTALTIAHEVGNVALVEAIEKAGGVGPMPRRKQTGSAVPLTIPEFIDAVKTDRLLIVSRYIDSGFDLQSTNSAYGKTALHEVAGNGRTATAQLLIAAGADVDAVTEQHVTPLHIAALAPNVPIVKALLLAGARIDLLSDRGMTAFHYAVGSGSTESVDALLNAGASIETRTATGYTPLMIAARENLTHMLELLLGRAADLSALSEGNKSSGQSALMLAASNDNLEAMQVLLNAGAAVSQAGTDAGTALHIATRRKHTDAIKLLVGAGANPLQADAHGYTPVSMAMQMGNTTMLAALLQAEAVTKSAAQRKTELLQSAIDSDNPLVLKEVLTVLSDLQSLLHGQTELLQRAIMSDHAKILAYLLDAGVELSPGLVSFALENDKELALGLLLAHGAQPNVADVSGRWPLEIALERGHPANMRLLLAYGANPNQHFGNGMTPLIFAISGGRVSNVQWLLDAGADPRMTSPNGEVPKKLAARYDYRVIQQLLNGAGANLRRDRL